MQRENDAIIVYIFVRVKIVNCSKTLNDRTLILVQ